MSTAQANNNHQETAAAVARASQGSVVELNTEARTHGARIHAAHYSTPSGPSASSNPFGTSSSAAAHVTHASYPYVPFQATRPAPPAGWTTPTAAVPVTMPVGGPLDAPIRLNGPVNGGRIIAGGPVGQHCNFNNLPPGAIVQGPYRDARCTSLTSSESSDEAPRRKRKNNRRRKSDYQPQSSSACVPFAIILIFAFLILGLVCMGTNPKFNPSACLPRC